MTIPWRLLNLYILYFRINVWKKRDGWFFMVIVYITRTEISEEGTEYWNKISRQNKSEFRTVVGYVVWGKGILKYWQWNICIKQRQFYWERNGSLCIVFELIFVNFKCKIAIELFAFRGKRKILSSFFFYGPLDQVWTRPPHCWGF